MNNNKDFIEYLEFLISNRIHSEYSIVDIRREIEDKIKELKSEGCGKEMYWDDNPESNIHWACGTEIKGEIDYCEDCENKFAKGRQRE